MNSFKIVVLTPAHEVSLVLTNIICYNSSADELLRIELNVPALAVVKYDKKGLLLR